MKKLWISIFSIIFSVTLVLGGTFLFDNIFNTQTSTEECVVDMPIQGNANWLDLAKNTRPGGSGTSSDPYRIDSEQTLANYMFMVNNDYRNTSNDVYYKSSYAKLTADLDLSGRYWTPIGCENSNIFVSTTYKGVFDGAGHTINNLTMRIYENDKTQFMGLFGYTNGATIKNLKIKYSLTVYAITEDGWWETESCYAGGIIGRNTGLTKLDTVTILEGSKLTYNRGSDQLPFEKAYISNFVGYSTGSLNIDDCVCYGDIVVSASNMTRESKNADLYCGGLIGASTGSLDIDYTCHYGDITITQPTSTDNPHNDNYQYLHVGGIIGKSSAASNIYRSIYSGAIKMTGSLWIRDGDAAIGGIVGKHTSGALTVNGCNNYADIDLSETHYMCVGGVVGSSDTSGNLNVRGCTNWGQITLRLTKEANTTGGFGGIVGQTASNYSYIRECINYGDVWFTTASYQAKFVGGILGYSLDDDGADHGRGYISNCMNFGKIGSNDGDVICVGGIAGELKDVDLSWKNWDNGALGYDWVYVYEGVYVTNCINMGMVSGGSSVGQIVGYLYDDLVYFNYISDKSNKPAVGSQYDGKTITATKKSLAAACNGTFLSTSSNWTDTVNDKLSNRYDSGDYYNYDTYYKIMSTQLPHGYYTNSQWKEKVGVGLSSLPTVIPTISGSIAGAKVTVYWNKPKSVKQDEKGYDTYSNEEAVSKLCARKHGSTASGWTEKTSTLTFRYLRGANYTGDRYLEAMKIVTADTNDFSPGGFSIVSTDSNTSKQQGLDIYGTYTNGAENYIKFRGFTYSHYTEIKLRFDYYAIGKSLANSLGTPVSSKRKDVAQSATSTTDYNVITPKIKKNSRTDNYTFYYKDTVSFEVTPKFGYRFAGLLAGPSSTVDSNNAVTKITNTALGKYDTGTTGFTYTYKQKYFVWLFDKVEYTIVFVDQASKTNGKSPVICEDAEDENPKALSSSVQTDYTATKPFVVSGGYAQSSDTLDFELESIAYGFSYTVRCGLGNDKWVSTNCYSDIYANNEGKLYMHMDLITQGMSSLSEAINQNKIYICVTKTAIEFDVSLHNWVQLYTQDSQTQMRADRDYINNYSGLPSYNKGEQKSVGGQSFFYEGDGGSLTDKVTFSRAQNGDTNWKLSLSESEFNDKSRYLYLLPKDGYHIYGKNTTNTVGIRIARTYLQDDGVHKIEYPEVFTSSGLDAAKYNEGDLYSILSKLLKEVCKYTTSAEDTNINDGVTYLKTAGIHLYVPYVLETYILDVYAEEINRDTIDTSSNVAYYKKGSSFPSSESSRKAVSIVTDSATADTSNHKVLYYYSPVSLFAKDYFANASKSYKFVGWYLQEDEETFRLLSTKTDYHFIVDPQIEKSAKFASGEGLRIVARYNASTNSGTASLSKVGECYTVSNNKDLAVLSELVAGGETFAGKIIKLTSNLSFTTADGVFTPIGTEASPFKGIFDGQNYTISGLDFGDTNTQKGIGLFGYLENATVKNLTVSHTVVKGFSYVGVIAGKAENTTFDNVHAYECFVATANISIYNIYIELISGSKVEYSISDAERGSGLKYEELESESQSAFENPIEKREYFSSFVGYATNCKLHMTSVRTSAKNDKLIEIKDTIFYQDPGVKPGFYFGYLAGYADKTTIDQSYVDARNLYANIPLHNSATLTNCYFRNRMGKMETQYFKNTTTEYVEGDLENYPNIWIKINTLWVLQIFYWN